jgi:hypothetical protein
MSGTIGGWTRHGCTVGVGGSGTDLDGKDEDGMDTDKEDIEPHLCCFANSFLKMVSCSRKAGAREVRADEAGIPASDVCLPYVDEMDTDREEN